MKFLKNNLKAIITFLIGVILSGSIVYAATVAANEVTYTTNKNGKVSTVADALNDLYINIKENSLFDLTNETTPSSTAYNLKKTTALLNPESHDILIRIQADKVTDSVNNYTIDISKLGLTSINYINAYNLGSSSNFYLVAENFNNSSISFYVDTNRYNSSKVNQDFIIKCSYSK